MKNSHALPRGKAPRLIWEKLGGGKLTAPLMTWTYNAGDWVKHNLQDFILQNRDSRQKKCFSNISFHGYRFYERFREAFSNPSEIDLTKKRD
jgi:hypothetical protein